MVDQLIYCINSYREAAMSNDPKFDHIDLVEKQKVGSLIYSNTFNLFRPFSFV